MNFQLGILLIVLSYAHAAEDSDEALRECGDLHNIEIQNIPNASALFENSKCLLRCFVGNKNLSTDAINQGLACPFDTTGICINGQCIGSKEEALHECSKLHNLDFHKIKSNGTSYANNLCTLNCVIDDYAISINVINEGLQCPTKINGICRKGKCFIDETSSVTTPLATTHLVTTPKVTLPTITTPKVTTPLATIPAIPVSTKASLTIADLEIGILTGSYQSNGHSVQFELFFCDSPDLKFTGCTSLCKTPNEAMNGLMHWNIHCSKMGRLTENSTLMTMLWNFKDEAIGESNENIYSIINGHYSHNVIPTGSSSFDQRSQIYADSNSVSEVTLRLKFVISKT